MKQINWFPVAGSFETARNHVVFKGGPLAIGESTGSAVGLAISDHSFSGGTISADVVFGGVEPKSQCNILFWYDPERRHFLGAGLAADPAALYGIWQFDTRWTMYSAGGDGKNLVPGRRYRLQAHLRGSRATLSVDGVVVAAATLPFSLPPSQAGLWCRGLHDITIDDFVVISETPRVFVVMQFGSPFDALHHEVLKTVCKEFGLEAIRADETYGPGVIIADVEKKIQEAKFIIADITPANPNVYYEVGYARAINKPTILLADRSVEKLPFDVSAFRTLFYENTIAGKSQVEEGLRRHITAVLTQTSL
jgi:hypothetical protein